MVCSNCGTENRAGRKFCSECAAPLALPCPSCGALNEPGEKFCGECAQPLPASGTTAPAGSHAPAPVSERRLVSILFADLVGFTTLAEGKDAEDTRELLSAYFDLSRDVIGRYGGTIEKFIGDAVMAVWGTPQAHEDDAARAVRAALDLVDAARAIRTPTGEQLQLRAGVLTGEAPDEVPVDVDEERDVLIVHLVDATDPDAVRARHHRAYERWQRRVVR